MKVLQTPKTKFEQELIFSKLQQPTYSKAKKILEKKLAKQNQEIFMHSRIQSEYYGFNRSNIVTPNSQGQSQNKQFGVSQQGFDDINPQLMRTQSEYISPLVSRKDQVINAFIEKKVNAKNSEILKQKEVIDDPNKFTYKKIEIPSSSKTIKKVTQFEKQVLSNLLNQYDQDNLDKINQELELNKASKNDKLIRMIDLCQSKTDEYIKEPQKKTEEQLEKLQKEIEFYSRSKKSRISQIEGLNFNGNEVAISDAQLISNGNPMEQLKQREEQKNKVTFSSQNQSNNRPQQILSYNAKDQSNSESKGVLKQNNFKRDFRLIEYAENDRDKAVVINTLEKEEIFSQEEDIDQADIRVKQMEKYIDRAHKHIKETFCETQESVAILENEKFQIQQIKEVEDFEDHMELEKRRKGLQQKFELIFDRIKFGDTLTVYQLLQLKPELATLRDQLGKSPYKLAIKISDQTTIEMFKQVRNEVYPFNHGKFDSLQYLDSIRSPQELKFRKITETIQNLKKEMEEEQRKKEEEALNKNYFNKGFRNF
eukprot:403340649